METWSAIWRLRAVRSFQDRPMERELLERIVGAGRRAPSSKNTQRREFIVCQDRERLRQLSAVGNFAQHVAGAAAAIALVTPRAADAAARESIAFDLGHAAQNMMLAAWDLGLGSVHGAVYDEATARRLLEYPRDRRCDYLISFGYPADQSIVTAPLGRGGRRPLDEIVHWERW